MPMTQQQGICQAIDPSSKIFKSRAQTVTTNAAWEWLYRRSCEKSRGIYQNPVRSRDVTGLPYSETLRTFFPANFGHNNSEDDKTDWLKQECMVPAGYAGVMGVGVQFAAAVLEPGC